MLYQYLSNYDFQTIVCHHVFVRIIKLNLIRINNKITAAKYKIKQE